MNTIDASTKVYGLIGQHISYSLSPVLHNHAMATLGINGVYLPFDLNAENLETFLEAMWHCGAVGFNVTQPHKQVVAKILKAPYKSVNTLYRGKNSWQATSTDGEGFWRGVLPLLPKDHAVRRAVILGSGGAAIAVAVHLAKVGVERVHILRRRDERDQALVEAVNGAVSAEAKRRLQLSFHALQVEDLADCFRAGGDSGAERGVENDARGVTLLVQGTSAPLHGDDLAWLVPALESYSGIFVDLVYGTPSALLTAARAANLPCQDGLPMLIEQARCAQEQWWGRSASYDTMLAAVPSHLQ